MSKNKININVLMLRFLSIAFTRNTFAQSMVSDKAPLNSKPYVAESLCRSPAKVVFSCPLKKNRKFVSMCAVGTTANHRFYYVFGRPESIEMTFPSEKNGLNKNFNRTFLSYPGGTGGYTYSFTNKDIKYIVYLISGGGFKYGGVIVQKKGEVHAISDIECEIGKIDESNNRSLIEETISWKSDEDINIHGLPDVD